MTGLEMKNNKAFKERLRNGNLLIGTLISLPSPEITEISGDNRNPLAVRI